MCLLSSTFVGALGNAVVGLLVIRNKLLY